MPCTGVHGICVKKDPAFPGIKVCRVQIMIDFDEELKKFYPSLEVDQLEEAVNRAELIDAVDIYVRMGKDAASVQAAAAQPVRDMRPGRRY